MIILNTAIIVFILMESMNVAVLYFKPHLTEGNGVGVFKGFHLAQSNTHERLFVKYLINWIANAKAIFIFLLAVILFTGTETIKLYTCMGMVFSIGLYFVTLHPLIKQLDAADMISPKGYSKGLGYMIAGFMAMFLFAIGFYLVL